jgi:methylated-DNA-protein-cysteine methyltransferase-like protein
VDGVLVERVLRAVELVPPGRVVTYGDLAELVGCGPRQVGTILRDVGDAVPWWRVVNASGDSPVMDAARPHWRAEGITPKPSGRGCRMSVSRADLAALAQAYAAAVSDLDAGAT